MADGIVCAAWEICGSVDVMGTDGVACAAAESGAPDSMPLLKLWASSVGEMVGVGGDGATAASGRIVRLPTIEDGGEPIGLTGVAGAVGAAVTDAGGKAADGPAMDR